MTAKPKRVEIGGVAPRHERSRVLMFSQRNIAADVLFRCPHYEFEDIICEMDSVDVVAPEVGRWFDFRKMVAKRLAWHTPITLNPGVPKVRAAGTYDLFFAICGSPVDLLMVNALENWQDVAKKSICLVDEMWVTEFGAYKFFLKILAKFDCVMMYYSESAKAANEVVGGRKFRFLAPGIDGIQFCPYPSLADRVIDIYSIGRRSEASHRALIRIAEETGRFYIYDSISGSRAIHWKEHRLLFANTAKRSRYFIVNPALIDRRDVRGDQNEMGNRYFEGAASGAVMIGERPQNQEFEKMFDWPDAVLDLPYGSTNVERIMKEVESRPDWEEEMRWSNVVQTLLRNDWAYRWEMVLDAAGLDPLQGLRDRKERLGRLAKAVSSWRVCH